MPGYIPRQLIDQVRADNSDPNWELTTRPAMFPFLADYTNAQTGEHAGGLAMPSMITEPINALMRLAQNSRFEDGSLGIPNPQNLDNQNDVLTGLLSMYGGNALKGAGVEAGAAVTGLKDTAQAVYRNWRYPDEFTPMGGSRMLRDYGGGNPTGGAPLRPADVSDLLNDYAPANINEARLRNEPARNFSVIDGDLLSDTGKPSLFGSLLASLYGGNATRGLGAGERAVLASKPELGAAVAGAEGNVSLQGAHPNYQIMQGADPVGRAYVREYPDTIQMGNLAIDEPFRRQGIATEAQRLLAEQYGKPNVPDMTLSEAEFARWLRNDPAAVADYQPWGPGSSQYSPASGSPAIRAAYGGPPVPGTRAAAGELFSDNLPSLWGSALSQDQNEKRNSLFNY